MATHFSRRLVFFVAEDPSRVLPAVCNALYNLTATLDANPDQWLDDMERMATACRNADEFLKCGKVAAWRAGLAHFREGAIDAAKTLTETLARVSLSAPLHVPLPALFERLGRDPWFNPGNTDDAEHEAGSRLRTVCRAGAFRGFGGLFPEPPLVAPSGEHFLVKSGSECWLLIADIFGATFHRSDPAEFKTSGRSGLPSGITIKRTTVRCNGLSLELSDLGQLHIGGRQQPHSGPYIAAHACGHFAGSDMTIQDKEIDESASSDMEALCRKWSAAWPEALAAWSKFTRLRPPVFVPDRQRCKT